MLCRPPVAVPADHRRLFLGVSSASFISTHNGTLAGKTAAGTGYLSAFPAECFDRFEAIKLVWAPYYTIHKIMQGLLDQYTVAGNPKALDMVVGMADYFSNRVKNVIQKYSIERHWTSLNEETGGMNDVLYQLYTITNDQRHLILAHLFDKPCFLGLLAVQEIATFFMDIVNSSHSYATGGTSVSEFCLHRVGAISGLYYLITLKAHCLQLYQI